MIETMGSSLLVVLTFHEQKTKGFNPVKGSKVGNVLHAEKPTEDGETLSSSLVGFFSRVWMPKPLSLRPNHKYLAGSSFLDFS